MVQVGEMSAMIMVIQSVPIFKGMQWTAAVLMKMAMKSTTFVGFVQMVLPFVPLRHKIR